MSECVNEKTIRPGFYISECPNMKTDPEDTSMHYEWYKCDVCGKRDCLDYEEMK